MYIYEAKMKEYAVEKHLVQKTQECGGICLKLISPGIAGVPDRIVVLPGGKIGFAEMKAPGRRPRLLQRAVIRDLYRRGCRIATIDNLKSVEGFVRRLAK